MDANAILSEALEAARRGVWAQAEHLCRSILQAEPRCFPAAVVLGDVLARAGKVDQALAAYDKASGLVPGQAVPFTRSAILRFRLAFGPPTEPRLPEPGPIGRRIQMTSLGANGRFGNQLLQYAFVRLYARQHNLVAELPDWIGRDLFDLDDPFPSAFLRPVEEKDENLIASLSNGSRAVLAETDVSGYLCGDTSLWNGRAREFRDLFSPGNNLRPLLERALARLKSVGNTIVAIHLRNADFGYGRFWVAPAAWYLGWLREIWPKLDSPILYVATDDRSLVGQFADFDPWDAERIGIEIPGADFMIDHHILSKADHVAVSNSTFSFTAAMLNTSALSFVRPHPTRRELVAFAPWGAKVLLDPLLEPDQVSEDEQTVLKQLFNSATCVVHLGRFCSAWTNLARSIYPSLPIRELDPTASIDSFRQERGIKHIGHVVLDTASSLSRFISGAARTLHHSRIDFVHFRGSAEEDLAPSGVALLKNGYALFRLAHGQIERLAPGTTITAGSYVAVQERLLPLFGAEAADLDLTMLCKKYGIAVRGVLHVGAHLGQEIATYDSMGAQRVVFIEANPAVHAQLAEAMRDRPNVLPVSRAISDKAGKVSLHLASFDQSSSLLAMDGHLEIYPGIVPVGTTEVDATTLDALVKELQLAGEEFNFLAVDVQGAEAMVLRGASQTLRHVQAINIEINFEELYRNCSEIEDIDTMLNSAGFKRVATVSGYHATWGDAFYVRS